MGLDMSEQEDEKNIKDEKSEKLLEQKETLIKKVI